MKTKLLSIIILLSIPLIAWAAGKPVIKKVTIGQPYGTGVDFSVEVLHFGDLNFGDLKVTFPPGQKAEITSKKGEVIKGVIPKGVDPAGGRLTVRLDDKEASFNLKIPYIESVFVPENLKLDDLMLISGKNFDPAKCQVKLDKKALKVHQCDYTQVRLKIHEKIVSGDLHITSYGFTGAPYRFQADAPRIDFIESRKGVRPGGEIRLHGQGFVSGGSGVQVLLEKQLLKILEVSGDGAAIRAQLPQTSFTGKVKVIREGLESNTVTIGSQKAPILTSFSRERQPDGGTLLTIKGHNFSPEKEENTVFVDKSKSKVIHAQIGELIAPLPDNITEGCLYVITSKVKSNCLYYAPLNKPTITGISEPSQDNQGEYHVTLTGYNFGTRANTTAYAKKAKQEITGILGDGTIEIKFTTLPQKGTIYVVSDGIKSNEVPFDFSDVGIPYIHRVVAPRGLSPGHPITLEGVNFGRQVDKDKVKINLNNGGVSDDFKVKPNTIGAHMDYKGTLYKELKLSVTIKGKKSNELIFDYDPDLKFISAGPVIKKVGYPEGIMEGAKMVIEGTGFAEPASLSIVHFKDQRSTGLEVRGKRLTVQIPKGVASGSLQVEVAGRKSNKLNYVAAQAKGQPFEARFETLDKNSFEFGEKSSDAVIARLGVKNRIGHLKIDKWIFDVEYKDDPDDPDSVRGLGVLPLGLIELKNKTVKGFDIGPRAVTCGRGECQITFEDFVLPPSDKEQIYEFGTTLAAFALSEATIQFKSSPAAATHFEARNQEQDPPSKLTLNDVREIASPVFTLYNRAVSCFDSEEDQRHCNAFLSGAAPASKPKTQPKTQPPAGPPTPESTPVTKPVPEAQTSKPEPKPVKKAPASETKLKKEPKPEPKPEPPKTVTKKRTRKVLTEKKKTGPGPLFPFRDSNEVAWAQTYINALKTNRIVTELPGNAFRPAEPITRADLLTYTLTGLQAQVASADPASLFFSDVSTGSAEAPFITWAVENGVIQGYPDGTFRGSAPVTRAEAVKIILTAGGFQVIGGKHNFKDLDGWQVPWVSSAYRRGIVKGVSPDRFDPNRSVTRAEAAKIIMETIGKYKSEVKEDQIIEFEVIVKEGTPASAPPKRPVAASGLPSCGTDSGCFDKNLQTCTPSEFQTGLNPQVQFLFTIQGPEGDTCRIRHVAVKNPSPEFKDTWYDCALPAAGLGAAAYQDWVRLNLLTQCTGTYVDAVKKKLKE